MSQEPWPGRHDMHKHVTILAAFYIGYSIALGAAGAFLVVALPVIGVAVDDPEALAILSTIGVLVGCFLVLLAIPGIVGGIGLLKRWSWARIFVLILGAIHVFNIPLGTLLGAYTIWVLVQDETERLFARPAAT